MTTTPTTILTSRAAIDYAEANGADLWKFADPAEVGRRVTVDEAREIAQEDPSLLWIDTADHDRAPWEDAPEFADMTKGLRASGVFGKEGWCLIDPDGKRWWPTDRCISEAEVRARYNESTMLGRWAQ